MNKTNRTTHPLLKSPTKSVILLLGVACWVLFLLQTLRRFPAEQMNYPDPAAWRPLPPGESQSKNPPLWPQTDDRIRRHIEERSERIEPDLDQVNTSHYKYQEQIFESPPTRTTLISAFYGIPSSKHPSTKYENWARHLFSSTDPLVFFCDPNSTWPELVRQNRQHAPTLLVLLPFEQLPTVSNFDTSFWLEHATAHDTYSTPYVTSKEVSVYQVWNSKIILVHETAQINPFQSTKFLWIDSGYFRETAVVREPVVRNPCRGVQDHEVLLHNVQPKRWGYLMAGGIWGGSAVALENFYKLYWQTFWFMVIHEIVNVGYEQHVFVHLCKSFPNVCNIHWAGGVQAWRIMGNDWIRNADYDFGPMSKTRLVYQANHSVAIGHLKRRPYRQPLVRGPVVFPHSFPIRSPSMIVSKE